MPSFYSATSSTQTDWSWHILVLLLGAVYVAFGLTPSSYEIVLATIGSPEEGLLLGQSRGIRSDEYAVWTPFIQAAINNGFARFNETSLYGEDLRNFNALPLLDWALIFKPQFWAFFFLCPALSFSIFHAVYFVAFLSGWHLLFRRLGFSSGWSVAATLALFFAGYTQLWWTTTGPLLAGFPWILALILQPLRTPLHIAIMAWLSGTWLMGHLYPPIIVSLSFAGVLLLIAARPDALSFIRLMPSVAGLSIGIALTVVYLWDAFEAMRSTLYPGQRLIGGGGVSWEEWATQFVPGFASTLEHSALDVNVLEAATGATWLPLLALIMLDFRTLAARARQDRAVVRRLAIPLAGVVLMTLWMTQPLPAWAGLPFLWHLVPPGRMVFAVGLLLMTAALFAMRDGGLRLTPLRLLLAGAIIVGLWVLSDARLAIMGWSETWQDLGMGLGLFAVAAALAYARWTSRPLPAATATVLIFGAAAANALSFGGFNPVQQSRPIFDAPQTAITQMLDDLLARHSRGWLVVGGFHGAALNGLGYPSVAHVLIAPQLERFRELFPDLPSEEFNEIFNRYGHIQLRPVAAPISPQGDLIRVPIEAFDPVQSFIVTVGPDAPRPADRAGYIDYFVQDGRTVIIRGWAPYRPGDYDRHMAVRTDLPVISARGMTLVRPDVVTAFNDATLGLSGFEIQLELVAPAEDMTGAGVCVIAENTERTPILVNNLVYPNACRLL